ncbi:MAG: NADH-quinone oxidoreductase subunit L [Planctomycetota bacterium]
MSMDLLSGIGTGLLAAADGPFIPGGSAPAFVGLMPLLPLVGAALCVLLACLGVKSKLPGYATVGLLAGSFVVAVLAYLGGNDGDSYGVATMFRWIHASAGDATLVANFAYYMDGLSMLWMLFVTGLATVIALYSTEYMSHDQGLGYCRFFFAFNVFVFSMSSLVMADNLLLLFLGWEGVGLCSYLLIGYFYKKPEAIAAAKKAFIINRIGDLGLLMAIGAIYVVFGTIELRPLFEMITQGVDGNGGAIDGTWVVVVIPLLLTAGAFGKSAQLFFYVWLPDAMEGPTPVSALIHAATMVTAGVYLIARMFPLYAADDAMIALTVVAWSGAITAFWAATIEFAQYDIKRIMGYSTISQLGYMFAGLGLLGTTGAVFHVFTHAFFKATLFLCCGAVMHGFGGQLSLRRLSGVMKMPGFQITGICMFIGCLSLSGVPFTAGYFSKDMILAQAFATPQEMIGGSFLIGLLLLLTAAMTAYYTFRVFFRVFVGPRHFEPGDDDHGDDHDNGHGHDGDHDPADEDEGDVLHTGFHPHAPGWAMNTAMVLLAVGTIAAAGLYFVNKKDHGWAGSMVGQSSAAFASPGLSHGSTGGEGHTLRPERSDGILPVALGDADGAASEAAAASAADDAVEAGTLLGQDPFKIMYYVSAVLGLIGIATAAWFHGPRGVWGLGLGNRRTPSAVRMDAVAARFGPIPRWAEHKWYVDEFYHALIVRPLRVASELFFIVDRLLVDGLVDLFGAAPRWIGHALRPAQNGVLHAYASGMVAGTAVLILVIVVVTLL